ncbi:MAG: hypothetical protein M1814_000754 [Vezdaea aestivalis]|nr:MAG: hypothetical protein M1814_000754 [Vezdaea aestivalis]
MPSPIEQVPRLKRQSHIYVSAAAAARFSFAPRAVPQVAPTCDRCGEVQPNSGRPRSSKLVWCGLCGNVIKSATINTMDNSPRARTEIAPLVIPATILRPDPSREMLDKDIERTMNEYRIMVQTSPAVSEGSVGSTSSSGSERGSAGREWFERENVESLVDRLERAQFWSKVRRELREGNDELDPEIEGLIMWQQQHVEMDHEREEM